MNQEFEKRICRHIAQAFSHPCDWVGAGMIKDHEDACLFGLIPSNYQRCMEVMEEVRHDRPDSAVASPKASAETSEE